MKRLPAAVIFLILYMAFLFNIERLELDNQNILNIQTFLYVLITILIVIMLSVPIFSKKQTALYVAFWLSVYLILKLLVFNDRPFLGGDYTYISVLEIALVAIGVLLADNLAGYISDFKEAVENITFNGFNKVRELEESMDEVQTEIYRSRRFQHPLTMVVVEPQNESLDTILNYSMKEVQRSMMSRYVSVSLARELRAQLRRTDHLFENYDKRQFVVLTPETSLEGSSVILRRVYKAANQLGVTVKCGVASFPEDAFTFEELLKQAESRLETRLILPEKSDLEVSGISKDKEEIDEVDNTVSD